jgi:hypothetical protein
MGERRFFQLFHQPFEPVSIHNGSGNEFRLFGIEIHEESSGSVSQFSHTILAVLQDVQHGSSAPVPKLMLFATMPSVNRIILGVLLGLGIGVLDVLLMLPMKFPDKTTALTGAFFSRFAIGFIAVHVTMPWHAAVSGAIVGLLVSIPDAIITKAYAPILITGLLFGAVAGWVGRTWGA